MLKKFLIGTFVAFVLLVGVTASAAYDFGPTALKVGSKGDYVKTLQQFVGASPVDGAFGLMTKAKVMAWQATNGLTADGIFGNMSKAKANDAQSNFPAGCVSASGYSSLTGLSCSTVVVPPGVGTLPAGCSSTVGFSSTTGAKCDGAVVGDNGPLTGGAGSIDVTSTSSNVEGKATENKNDVKVLGFKVEAMDSDIALTHLKVELKNINSANSSERLTDYINTVKIVMGSTVVATANASDFSRDSGPSDIFSKTIALSNVVIRENNKTTFHIEVSSGSVDSNDLDANWNVRVSTVRYQDATGIVLSKEINNQISSELWTSTGAEDFGYENSLANDLLSVKSSIADPDTQSIAVSANDETKAKLIGAFKLKVDSDSSDIKINEIPVIITFAANGDTADDFADNVISLLKVKIDGTPYDADLATADDATLNGSGIATYRVDLVDYDVMIDSGDTVDVEIYADFNDQSGNYADGTTVTASVADDSIDAEGAGADTLGTSEKTGSYSGNTQTLSLTAATLSSLSWVTASGTNAGTIDFMFTLKADGDNDVTGFAFTDVVSTSTNTNAGVLTKVSGDATQTSVDPAAKVFTIGSGDSANFRVRYTMNASGAEVKVTSIQGQTVPDNKQLSPTVYYQ